MPRVTKPAAETAPVVTWTYPVTRWCLDHGVPKDCRNCMLSLGGKEADPNDPQNPHKSKVHYMSTFLNEAITIEGKPGQKRVRRVWHLPRYAIRKVIDHDYNGKRNIRPFSVTLTQVGAPVELPPLTPEERQINRIMMAKKRSDWAAAGKKPRTYSKQERVMGI